MYFRRTFIRIKFVFFFFEKTIFIEIFLNFQFQKIYKSFIVKGKLYFSSYKYFKLNCRNSGKTVQNEKYSTSKTLLEIFILSSIH